MSKDRIAITVSAVIFTLAFALPLCRAVWHWLTRRGATVVSEVEGDYYYEASPDGVKAGALAKGKE